MDCYYFSCPGRSSTDSWKCSGRSRRDEMDLTAFANFVLAWDQRSHPTAIKYLFPVLDLKNQVKPKTATLITAEDLEVSGMSGIFSMLTDVKLFHNYNYQEPGAVPILLPGWEDEGGRTSSTKRKAEGQAQGHQVPQVRHHSTLVLKVLT
ncbi:hypothetical protein QJQ45_015291 [Haematococcus lacustris]|nr:hypothetical protein QJQ45_015291 [Haematococcus lacustris]